MNYVQLVEEAIEFFTKLAKADKKEKAELIEGISKNEIAKKLVGYLKDEAVAFADFIMPEPAPLNEGHNRLGNYLRFVQLVLAIKKMDSVDENIIKYAFTRFDEVEQKIYHAILSNAISLPETKEATKEVKSKKEAKKEQTV